MYDKKHDEVSEALMRRRHEYAKKVPAHEAAHAKAPPPHDAGYAKQPPANQGTHQITPVEASEENRGEGMEAPQGATPVNEDGGDAMVLTPEMFAEHMGSGNAHGLRARVLEHAAAMKKKK